MNYGLRKRIQGRTEKDSPSKERRVGVVGSETQGQLFGVNHQY